jgi:hypothetical protein
MAERAPSPTPSERKRLDKDAKAKEQEEQSKLPYKWTQTIADLEVTIEVPGNFKGKDLDVKIKKDGVKAGIKGQEAILEVCSMLPTPGLVVYTALLFFLAVTDDPRFARYRAPSPTPSSSTTPPGRSKAHPRAQRSSASSSPRRTRWNGGSTS